MKAQYTVDRVLVRPFEPISTQFLSSRFYDGRKIVDALETPELAEQWFAVMTQELSRPPVAHVDARALDALRGLRDGVATVYEHALGNNRDQIADSLNALVGSVEIDPAIPKRQSQALIDFAGRGNPLESFMAEVALSCAFTVSAPQVAQLEKCEGPNCVLYYTRMRDSQHWCSNTCGNRARVARHARK